MCRQVCRKDVMQRSEMESFRTFSSLELVRANACNRYVNILHSIGMRQHQLHFDSEIASRWDAYLLCDLCRHFASVMLRLASLISHNLRCIPAYTHQIPMGFFLAHNSDIILNINHLERTRNIASLPCETVLGGLIHSSLFVLGRGLCPDISQIYSIFAPENINAT